MNLKRQVERLGVDSVLADWKEILLRTEFVGGPTVLKFEAEMKSRLGVDHFVACANGTDALMLALQASGIKRGQKVALPNLTFWATYEAVIQIGAEPILIDIDPDTLQMDFEEFKEAHSKFRFDAAILVHLMGWASPDTQKIRKYCSENGVFLVEDGAQAFGVKLGREDIFLQAQIGTHSFYPAKVLGGAMDGGGISTQDAVLAERCRRLRDHGRRDHYSYSEVGWNSRMGGLQATWLLKNLAIIDESLCSRRNALSLYHKELANLPGVRFFAPPSGVTGNAYLVVLSLEPGQVASVIQKLQSAGIGTGRVYPQTIDQQVPALGAERVSDLKYSQAFCKGVINLPIFNGISESEVNVVIAAFKDAIR